jgi:hypothetical protein
MTEESAQGESCPQEIGGAVADQIVAPGGRLTFFANGAYDVVVKDASSENRLKATVSVTEQHRHQPGPEMAASLPDFEVPDGGAITLERNGSFLVKVAGKDLTLVVNVLVDPPRHHVGAERRLP